VIQGDGVKARVQAFTSTGGRSREELLQATGLLNVRSEQGGVVSRHGVAGSGQHGVDGVGGDISARVAEDDGSKTGHQLVLIGTGNLERKRHLWYIEQKVL
jgi:hypothetical protein